MPTKIIFFLFFFATFTLSAQNFFFGNDLSYVNEMEDCGVVYKEKAIPKDPYRIFADNGCNLVRLRLWHTPAWYDTLNAGKRYSDFQDVEKSILRAKSAGMAVLLDFHLSDTWADPGHQVVPAAWKNVVNNLPTLKDSVYNYIFQTLLKLHDKSLLPEMVQIGNETNRGILLSQAEDATNPPINWARNSQLFNAGIKAVRDAEIATAKKIKIAIHIAGPEASGLAEDFWKNGVRDFDIIGLSYYWAWHKPTTIAVTGNIIRQLRQKYVGKEVMIFETGYVWTMQGNDQANNIINEVHPNYAPATPENQRRWCVDLTQEVINSGGKGVFYWEPAWVSSTCYTPWGRGSHQEHATFFDFNNNVLPNGGMGWMLHRYNNLTKTKAINASRRLNITVQNNHRALLLKFDNFKLDSTGQIKVLDSAGKVVATQNVSPAVSNISSVTLALPTLPAGIYFVTVATKSQVWAAEKVWLKQE